MKKRNLKFILDLKSRVFDLYLILVDLGHEGNTTMKYKKSYRIVSWQKLPLSYDFSTLFILHCCALTLLTIIWLLLNVYKYNRWNLLFSCVKIHTHLLIYFLIYVKVYVCGGGQLCVKWHINYVSTATNLPFKYCDMLMRKYATGQSLSWKNRGV